MEKDYKTETTTTILNQFETSSCSSNDKINSKKNGILYLISNDIFDKNHIKHFGNYEDENALIKTFRHFDFEIIETFRNYTIDEIKEQIEKISEIDYSCYKNFAIAILTFGHRYGLLWAKNGEYNLDSCIILPILRNRTLKDKIKLFIIESNRGQFDLLTQNIDSISFQETYCLSDCLRFYAANEGFKSLPRDRKIGGTYFIQTFCEQLMKFGHNTCVIEIMKKTIDEVQKLTRSKQIPCYVSCLTKPFILGNSNN